jgi:MFS family permease
MNKLKWFTISQGIVLFGMGLVFPFYIIFIKEVGASFTEFSIAYSLFALSSAISHKFSGHYSDKFGRKFFLLLSSWSIAIILLLFPIVTNIIQVYCLQIVLGIFGAMQKTNEKSIIADFTSKETRGKQIGDYHSIISIFSAVSIVLGGFLIDLFTLEIIFYIGSLILFISGFFILNINERDI